MGITLNRQLAIRWPDVESSYWSNVDPTRKVALGLCALPTLGQRSECGPSTLGPRGPAGETQLTMIDDGLTLNVDLVALLFFRESGPVLPRNPVFCDFSGGGVEPTPASHSGSAHVVYTLRCFLVFKITTFAHYECV